MKQLKVSLNILALLVLVSTVISQTTVPTGVQTQDTIQPCSTKFYKWTVSTSSQRFYLKVAFSAQTPNFVYDVSISNQAPSANQATTVVYPLNGTELICSTAQCRVTPPATQCELQLACQVTTGDYYIRVDGDTSATTVGSYQFTPSIIQIPSTNITIVANNQTITVPQPQSGNPAEFSNYDLFTFTFPQSQPGRRFIIEAEEESSTVDFFINPNSAAFPDTSSCFVFSATKKLTINSCNLAALQGQTWFLTARRASGTSYKIRSYIEDPIIEEFTLGNRPYPFGKLKEVDDIIYYKFNDLAGLTTQATFVAVVDNVEHGEVVLGIQYKNLPFQSCGELKCQTDASCHIPVYYCDLATKVEPGSSWYLGVQATRLDNDNTPVQFTVRAYVYPQNATDLIPGVPYASELQRTIYHQFRVAKPVSNQEWVQVHAYIDATRTSQINEAELYLSNQPNSGDGQCYKYTAPYTCVLQQTNDDVKSCSIQLDPCELTQFTDFIYIGFFANSQSDVHYYDQERVHYTITPRVYNPNLPPYLLLSNSDFVVLNDVVAETETNLYRIDNFVGTITAALTTADDPFTNTTTAGVQLQLVYGAESQGPSCPCWNSFVNASTFVNSSETGLVSVQTCEASGQTIFIAVTGIPDPSNDGSGNTNYQYVENQYTLTVRRTVQVSPPVIQLQENQVYTDEFKSGSVLYFNLNGFARERLTSKTLIVKLRAHPKLDLMVDLIPFKDSLQTFTCGFTSTSSCHIGFNNDGFCTITENCIFTSDTDNRIFVASVRAGNNSVFTGGNSPLDVFSIQYIIVENIPQLLVDSTYYANVLQKDVYQHYYMDVTPDIAKRRNLLVEVYFDAGYQFYDNTPITLFINTPALPRLAGDPLTDPCLCNEIKISNTQKVVWFVNSCGLVAGKYYFSVLTRQPVYDTFPAKYTIRASLQNPLIPMNYENPIDVSYYQGQVFSLYVPVSASTVSAITDTNKIIKTRVTATTVGNPIIDNIEVFISTVPPSDALLSDGSSNCSCYQAPYDCSTSTDGFCEIEIPYCALSVGNLYITPFLTSTKDPNNPTTVSTFVTKANTHQNIIPTVFTQGCGGRAGPQFATDNKNYQHFSMNLGNAGVQDRVELRVRNVTGGSVTVRFYNGNLAVAGCSSLNVDVPDGTEEREIVLNCGSTYTHFSVYANSNNNDPVTYQVYGCYTQVSAITLVPILNPGQATPITLNSSFPTQVFQFSMAPLPADNLLPFIRVIQNGNVGSPPIITISNGACTACAGSFRLSKPCNPDGTCPPFYRCSFPNNFRTNPNYFLEVQNTAGNTLTTNIFLVHDTIGTTMDLPLGVDTVVTVNGTANSDEAFQVVRFTLNAADLLAATRGFQTAEIVVSTASAGDGSQVESFFSAGSIAQPDCPADRRTHGSQQTYTIGGQCCGTPGVYYINFHNMGSSPTTFTVTPRLKSLSNHTSVTWNTQTNSATFTTSVGYNSENTLRNVVLVPFPGLGSNKYAETIVNITNTETTNGRWYIQRNAVAGPAPPGCYSNFDNGNLGTSQTDQIKILRFFSCDRRVFPADDYWFAFENQNTDPQSFANFTVTITNVLPTTLPFNVNSTLYDVNYEDYKQIIVDVPPVFWKDREIVFRINATTNDVVWAVSTSGPAGDINDDAPIQSCLNADFIPVTTVTSGNNNERVYSSCTITSRRFFIGVKGNTQGQVSQFSVGVFIRDPEPAITLPRFGETFSSETKTFVTTSPSSITSPRTYITLVADNLNPLTTKPVLDSWTSNNDCQSFDTSYCDGSATSSNCSVIIYPCLLSTNTQYFFDVNVGGSSTMDLSANVTVGTLAAQIAPGTTIKSTVLQHQLAFFQTTITQDVLKPGQFVSISFDGQSCGTVEVWINKASPAGKYCNIQNDTVIRSPGVLHTINACEEVDWADEYFITVRGLKQNNNNIPIQFRLSVGVSDTIPTFRSMHTNEKHPIFAVVPPTKPAGPTCPAPRSTFAPINCCPNAPGSGTFTYVPENVHFVYAVEGAHYLEYMNTITLTLTEYAVSANLYVRVERPMFCRDNISEPTCFANFQNKTCTVALDNCAYRDIRHFYVHADVQIYNNITVDPRFVNNKIPIAYITNNRKQYSITGVDFSDTPKYMQFALVPGETQYIQVIHPPTSTITQLPNYRFTATVVTVLGVNSEISLLSDNWDTCSTLPFCTDVGNCATPLPELPPTDCNPLPPCKCQDQTIPCEYGSDLNVNSQSFLRVKNTGTGFAVAKIRMKFLEVEEVISPNCDVVNNTQSRYYLQSVGTPSATQYWSYNLLYYQDFQGKVNNLPGSGVRLTLNEDELALPFTCQDTENCVATDSGLGCTINFRREGTPHLAVSPITSVPSSYYRLTGKFVTVNPVTLQNRVPFTSPYIDTTGSCPLNTTTQWYLFTQASQGNYMYVELTAAPFTTVWMHRDHITYRWGERSCTTDASGYCFFVFACNYAVTNYYFHVDTPVHTITVSALTVNPIPISIDSTTNVNLPVRQVVSYQLNVAQTDDTPTKDLHIDYGVIDTSVRVWVTRGGFGDPVCAVANINVNPSDTNFIINTCNIRKQSDTFFINFVAVNRAVCASSPFSITPKFLYGDSIATAGSSTGLLTNQQAYPGQTKRMKFNIGALTASDIVYVRITNVVNGALTHSVWKSNHIGPAVTTPSTFPCPGCQAPQKFSYITWYDVCWHCASYDAVYVDVDASEVGFGDAYVSFDIAVSKASWQELSENPITTVFADSPGTTGIEGNYAFFSASLDQSMGHRIELMVTSGEVVTVEVMGAPCDHRNVITVYCYAGMVCEIPFPYDGNFGSFRPFNGTNSLAPSTSYIVVRGTRSTFAIKETHGLTSCTAISSTSAPFCDGFTLRAENWGNGETFPQKDARSTDRYNELVQAFSCAGECLCKTLTQPCLDNLKRYSCDESFMSCSDQGFGLRPRARLCADVERTCDKTFVDAGYPELACFHSFYLANAAKWVNAFGTPIRPPNPDLDQTINGQAAGSAPAGVPAPPLDTSSQATGSGIGPVADAPEFVVTSANGPQANGPQAFGPDANGPQANGPQNGPNNPQGQTTTPVATASTSPSGPNGVDGSQAGLSGGAIAGIVIGVLLAVAIIGGLVYWFVIKGGSGGEYKNFDQT